MQKTKWFTASGKFGLVMMLLSACLTARAQGGTGQATPPAPFPAQIANAKSVFISNTAPDGMPSDMLQSYGEPNRPYDQLYGAMKKWGRYALADAPADADLVMEIHFMRSNATGGMGEGAEFYVSILDRKTHFVLWTFVEPVKGAIRKVSWEKNIDASVRALVNDLRDTNRAASAQAGNEGQHK